MPMGTEELSAAVRTVLTTEGSLNVHAVIQPARNVLSLVNARHFIRGNPTRQRWCATFLRRPPIKDPIPRLLARGYDVIHRDETVVLTAYDHYLPPMDRVNALVESAAGRAATTRWWNVVADFAMIP